MTRILRTAGLASAALALLLTGCRDDPFYAQAPPPPPAYPNAPPPYSDRREQAEIPPLIQAADRNGFRAGFDDGARDAYYDAGYAPRRDAKFRDAPGYDYRLGPIPRYVESFRQAYLRGYQQSFYGNAPR